MAVLPAPLCSDIGNIDVHAVAVKTKDQNKEGWRREQTETDMQIGRNLF
jgi:hypothetical protein